MDSKNAKEEQRALDEVKARAQHALDLFEGTRNEDESIAAEKSVLVAAEIARDTIQRSINDEAGSVSKIEARELKDLDKVITHENKAIDSASKNDLYFEDHHGIRAEEAAADAAERAAEMRSIFEDKNDNKE